MIPGPVRLERGIAVVLCAVTLGAVLGMLLAVAQNTKESVLILRRIEKQQRTRSCTHGESSIIAEMRHGKLYVSTPVVTGCQP